MQFLNTFTKQLKEEADKLGIPSVVDDYEFGMETSMRCGKCGSEVEDTERGECVLSIPIPENSHGYFEISFVPFNLTLGSQAIRKYGFELSKKATLVHQSACLETVQEEV